MAKKKLSNPSQSKDPKNQSLNQQHVLLSQPIPMADDSSSALQIQNLKNLNAVLLKETTQSRSQIHSLQNTLHRSSAMSYDSSLASDLHDAVVSVFLKNQLLEVNLLFDALVAEKSSEVAALERQLSGLAARLESEKSALEEERDGLLREMKVLEESVRTERRLREDAERLRSEGEEVLSQKQRDIAELKAERDSAVKSSEEFVAVIETLKEEALAVTKEKNEIQRGSEVQEKRIASLDMELRTLDVSSKKEEEISRAKILELEENLDVALQKEENMKMEIGALLREKKEVEKNFEMLTDEKVNVREALNLVLKELHDKEHELDGAIKAKNEIEGMKFNLENEIVELRGQVDELKDSCRNYEEGNKELDSQVKRCRNAVDVAVLEKESMRKVFDEEKKKTEELQLKIAGLEEVAAKNEAELGHVRSERDKLVKKEKKLEGNVGVLRKENDALQGKLGEALKVNGELNAKAEAWCSNSDKALALLRATATALVCQHKERGGVQEDGAAADENHVEEIQPYAQELDAIKKAFKTKDEMVDDMKQQLVSLNKSVVEAHKSKSLWTIISSATTIFAAVLAAYVVRGR